MTIPLANNKFVFDVFTETDVNVYKLQRCNSI